MGRFPHSRISSKLPFLLCIKKWCQNCQILAMKPLACVLRLNFISPCSPKSKYYISTLSWEPIQNAWHWELLYFCDYRCKILYNSICKQGEFITVYSWIWNPDVQFACAACSVQCLSCMHKIFSSSAIPYRLALEFDWQANGAKFPFWGGRGWCR